MCTSSSCCLLRALDLATSHPFRNKLHNGWSQHHSTPHRRAGASFRGACRLGEIATVPLSQSKAPRRVPKGRDHTRRLKL
ncbi:hypothetical protein K437DRAFT_3220 [Tilletiaria anomala UBC 951]|uniref:Uncharacterized protein n=1 Tax=Tilletiaria anomala (strain ATCC 24038 / CBS 436.72 / UBC 951) TaxID=1037660 RepID=A0A066WHV7_TILAU|nr:uncharacterized protein K437DRAFT_3220 [Tilletiaria anomala UBC 951]KDN53602.1 hypothetical protein K437DRAFT_3220 [Tilletiaria anomala UBC 951]